MTARLHRGCYFRRRLHALRRWLRVRASAQDDPSTEHAHQCRSARRGALAQCRRRDSNPRHADYDSGQIWLGHREFRAGWTRRWTQPHVRRHGIPRVRRIELHCRPEVTVRSRDEPCSSPWFDQLLRFVSLRSALVEFRLEGIVDWGRTARVSRRAWRLEAMNTHRTGQSDVHRRHPCLVAPVSPEIRLSRREVRTMSRVAALLRRRAARLPADSFLRAELMEAAEYYAVGADQALAGHSRQAARRDWAR